MLERRPIEIAKINKTAQPMPELAFDVRKALKASIKEKGIIYPILVEKITDASFDIIDGRNRFEIAKELGLKEIDCLISDPQDPYATVLMYDLEICRRFLTVDERQKYQEQRDAYVKECGERKFKHISATIIPELKDMARKSFEANSDSAGLSSLVTLSNLSPEKQKMFIVEKDGRTNITELKSKVAELQTEIIGLNKTVKEKEALEKELQFLQDGFKKQIEERMAKKEAEMEKKYKDVAPGKLAEMIAAEKTKIQAELEEQYEADLDEARKKLVAATTATAAVQKKLEAVNETLVITKRKSEEAQKLAVKFEKESEHLQKAIQQLSSPEALLKKLDSILIEAKAVAKKIEALQSDALNVCKGVIAAKGNLNGTTNTVQSKMDEITDLLAELKTEKIAAVFAETMTRMKAK